jgi:ATP-binding cassette, subfamily B, bacterial
VPNGAEAEAEAEAVVLLSAMRGGLQGGGTVYSGRPPPGRNDPMDVTSNLFMASRRKPRPPPPRTPRERLQHATQVWRQVLPTLSLLWTAAPVGTAVLLALTVVQALLPPAIAWVAKLIIDAVVLAQQTSAESDRHQVLLFVGLEFLLVGASLVIRRGEGLAQTIVGAHLKRSLSVRVLDKALLLELAHFEDSALYDKMQNARREADRRPLGLALHVLAVLQNGITLLTYAGLILTLAPWALPVLFLASLPSFLAEVRFAGENFRVMTWRAPEGRRLNYLEWLLTRDSTVKEVKLFGLGPLVLGRFTGLYDKIVAEDRRLAIKRAGWGVVLALLSLLAFYVCYAAIAHRAATGLLTLGDLAFALAAFRQGQTAFQAVLTALGAMVEDALFMSNLFAYLHVNADGEQPRKLPAKTIPPGPQPLVLDGVGFAYPGHDEQVLTDISLTIAAGEKIALVGENGAGKSTLVKLLLRFYAPTAGRITWGGTDLQDVDPAALRGRVGAVFQDFVRYQLPVRENVGVGDVKTIDGRLDETEATARIERAVERAGAGGVVQKAGGLLGMLGGWFEDGQDLSGGEWQKLALARAFVREDTSLLILDEPTAAIDAAAEAELFDQIQTLAAGKTALLISHRFSTVRMADRILVLHGGRIVEQGSHDELVALGGRYATLFALQARGYQ